MLQLACFDTCPLSVLCWYQGMLPKVFAYVISQTMFTWSIVLIICSFLRGSIDYNESTLPLSDQLAIALTASLNSLLRCSIAKSIEMCRPLPPHTLAVRFHLRWLAMTFEFVSMSALVSQYVQINEVLQYKHKNQLPVSNMKSWRIKYKQISTRIMINEIIHLNLSRWRSCRSLFLPDNCWNWYFYSRSPLHNCLVSPQRYTYHVWIITRLGELQFPSFVRWSLCQWTNLQN